MPGRTAPARIELRNMYSNQRFSPQPPPQSKADEWAQGFSRLLQRSGYTEAPLWAVGLGRHGACRQIAKTGLTAPDGSARACSSAAKATVGPDESSQLGPDPAKTASR